MKRTLAAKVVRLLVLLLGVAVSAASASVLVNKAFSPPTVGLGASSVVTVTLSNTSTAAAANITSFADDLATMGGHAALAAAPNFSTTCSGASVSHSGTVVSLTGGVIPVAADSTHPGTCTLTFTVAGAAVGNGINTIAAGALVTDQGANATAASQTLQVQSAVLTVSGSASTSVAASSTTTQSFTVTNPTAAQITNTGFALTFNSYGASFTLSGASTSCGGSVALTAFPATSGTATASGLTLPANGSCTVTLTVSDPNATAMTVNGNLAASAITDTQGITSNTAVSDTSNFVSGNPNLNLSFSPSTVVAGATSRLSVSIANNSTSPLTSVGFSDALPAYMTLDGNPAATLTNCGSATVTGSGSGTFGLSGATIAAATTLGNSTSASTCTVTVTVDTSTSATSTLYDTLSSITDAQGLAVQSSASASLRIATTEFTVSKSFSNGNSAPRDTPQQVSLRFTNATSSALTNGSFTDDLPQSPVSMLYDSSYTPTLSSGCSGGTISASSGNTVVSGTGIGVAANSSCTVTFEVYLVSGGLPVQTDTNSLGAGAVSFTDGSSNVVTTTSSTSDVLSTGPAFSVSNFSSSASGVAGQPLTVTGRISDNAASGITDTNVVATFTLNSTSSPHKLWLAASPNVTISGGGTCSNLTANASANAESFTITGPSLNTTCTVTYNVVNEGTISGASASYGTGTNSYASTENNGTSTSTSSRTATFYTTSLLVNELFTPNSISSGATATEKVTLDVNGVTALSKTEADGVTFAQTLPANVTFAAAPNITYSSGCQQTSQTSPVYAISGTTITFSNISLLATGTTSTDCNVTFDVTSESLGNATSTVAAGSVTSMSGATNASAASASLSVVAGVALQNTFLSSSFAIGDVDDVRLVIVNSSTGALNGGTLSDTLPANLVLASTTAQPSTQSGDPAACGGTLNGTVGGNSFTLAGMSVAGAAGSSSPGECVRYVQVMAASTAAPGTASNAIAADALTIGGLQNATAATAAATLTAAPNGTLTQTFAPSAIAPAGVSQLTITFANTATLAAALSGMGLSDTLPSGVTIASPPSMSTTCGSGALTATGGGSGVTLAGGTVAAGAVCTVSVNVTGSTLNTYTNTLGAGALTTVQGATNGASTAALTITASPSPSPSPLLSLVLTASTLSAAPGTAITYTETFSNAGNVVLRPSLITIPIPNGTCFVYGSASSLSLPAGVSATIGYTSAAATPYTPVSGACGLNVTGYDALVTSVVWTLGGSLAVGAGGTIRLSTLVP